MTADEAQAFEEDDLFDQYVAIRRWDDLAKKNTAIFTGTVSLQANDD